MLQASQRLPHAHKASDQDVNIDKAHVHHQATSIDDTITLDHDTRKKARIKGITDNGQEIGIFMQRGQALLVGEILVTECGLHIEIVGKDEDVTTAISTDWLAFARVCYHLGNRHTSLQIGELWVRFKPDHVLEELAQNYGLSIDKTPAIFEPESGAYGNTAHAHSHAHD
jgi:urease accessory protein